MYIANTSVALSATLAFLIDTLKAFLAVPKTQTVSKLKEAYHQWVNVLASPCVVAYCTQVVVSALWASEAVTSLNL